MPKSFIAKFRFQARNIVFSKIFRVLAQHVKGKVIDIGGRDFFHTAKFKGLVYESWVNVDYKIEEQNNSQEQRFYQVSADGCQLPFRENQFDTALCIQVLEHVMDPVKMVQETARVLKPGGKGVFVVPQTSVLHEIPQHYYNFTRYWIREAMAASGLTILELHALGGRWMSTASHYLHMFFQMARMEGLSSPEYKRNFFFYILSPFMILFALISFPFCFIFSLGDLTEEPNNYIVVVEK